MGAIFYYFFLETLLFRTAYRVRMKSALANGSVRTRPKIPPIKTLKLKANFSLVTTRVTVYRPNSAKCRH